ncbi:MAG: dockerin type I repeat-containing protein [Candidatus Zixiibacteriota bacterium]
MRRSPLVLACLVFGVVCFFSQSWAQCPEDPNDNGVCDTLYIEIWPGDDWVEGFPHIVRFPIRVTNDIPDPDIDSIAGMVVPLSFASTNPLANAQIEAARNTADLHPFPDLDNSIFRHMPSMVDPQERNWMMDLSEQMVGREWDTRILDIGTGDHFWMSLVASGSQDERFKGGSRVLLATATFTIEDTTTICIDSCHWPPVGRLAFSRSDAITYIPRHFLPLCQKILILCNMPPQFYYGPWDRWHHSVGHYFTENFLVGHECGIMTAVSANFVGGGVENVTVFLYGGLPAYWVEGHVEYDVVDTCQSGGTVTILGHSNNGTAYHDFTIHLPNDPPYLTLPDTWRALSDHTMGLQVSASDPDDHPVTIELEGFWYEPDSLQPPVNPPSFDGGNPGFFSWAPTGSETGTWICSFRATDACGDEVTHQISIEVGMLYCGDCNGDGEINLADVVYLVADLFKGGPPPDPICRGDGNCSGVRDVGDIVVLINYLFKYGLAPCFDCCVGG